MSVISPSPGSRGAGRVSTPVAQAAPTPRERAATILSSAVAAILGVLPHVLHHVGPLAGAALLAGTGGTLLFGAIGLVAAIPFLLRVHRRCNNWRVPALLLATFAAMFSISAFAVGPAISGSDNDAGKTVPTEQTAPGAATKAGHDAHH